MHMSERILEKGVRSVEQVAARPETSLARNTLMLFLASFLALYFELVVIRYLSTEIRVFAYLKNLALVASFFGIGLGMILGESPKTMRRFFPIFALLLFFVVAFASPLKLTHLPVPGGQYEMFGQPAQTPSGLLGILLVPFMVWIFFAVVAGVLNLVVMFFLALGGLIGERLALLEPLRGYGINLAGSLAGILAFTALSFSAAPPVVWILVGIAVAIPFFIRERGSLAAFALLICLLATPQARNLADHNYDFGGHTLRQNTFWSPYYRITFYEFPPPPGWPRPPAYFLDVNHDYHQKILDLSPEFTERFPDTEPNHSGIAAYGLAYRLVPHPSQVLVVGAGTGNDVAAALRYGAEHVDAVEIDPYLVKLGRRYHPEHPYDSSRVTVVVDDARAFFKRATQKYDLIIFGFLDSHTMFSSLSVLRLDDYVYTFESFKEARDLLTDNGTAVLAFDSGRTSFITDRIFFTLTRAFGKPPIAYYTGYDSAGVAFVEGKGAEFKLADYPEISTELRSHEASAIVSTDHWPFLYLQSRTIPISMLGVIVLFLAFSFRLLRRKVPIPDLANAQNLHLFLLGAGFMLLETKAVTELSLLFGSTWIVNAVVITAFLVMGLLANTIMMFRSGSDQLAYAVLFALLAIDIFLPYSWFGGLPAGVRTFAAATFAALPIFFSGVIFSRAFREVVRPAEGLGVNLLGAVIGGVLENTVMIGGTPILGILAIILYGGSAVALNPRIARSELTSSS
jgi:predicted RNA methylase